MQDQLRWLILGVIVMVGMACMSTPKCLKVVAIPSLVVAVGLMVNNRGFLGILPLIATVELTLANYSDRRVVFIKASLWINTVIWMIYSYLIFDFAAGIMQTVISVLGLISLLQCIRNNG